MPHVVALCMQMIHLIELSCLKRAQLMVPEGLTIASSNESLLSLSFELILQD